LETQEATREPWIYAVLVTHKQKNTWPIQSLVAT